MAIINLLRIIFATITSSASSLSRVIALDVFTKYRNLMLETPGLATDSYVTTNNALTIWIYNQAFAS